MLFFLNPALSKDSVSRSPFWNLLSNLLNSHVLDAFTVAGPRPVNPAAEIQSSEGGGPCYGQYDGKDGAHISTLRRGLLSSSPEFRLFGFASYGGCDLILKFKLDLRQVAVWLTIAGLMAGLPTLGQAPPTPVAPLAPQRMNTPGKFVVVLDAAHGGDDGGGQVGASVSEKTVTLALSVRLRSLLTARGFTVITTREGNVNLDGDARSQIANHAGAAACLSFHASASGAGVHLFVSSLAPRQAERFLAWKTAQAGYVERSLKLAGALNSAFQHGGDSGPVPATLARASLPGVDSMACPAVAVEVAPTRGADRAIVTDVTDPQYQAQIVEALAAALLEWKTDWETDPSPSLPKGSGGRQP
jgi:N-acetylmuramoyl-L-alanine amidase